MTEPEAAGALSYEQARDELMDVVRKLEAGGVTLEESLALWERGEELAAVCGRWLQGARERLDAALARDTADEQADGQEERGGGQRQAADGAAAEDGGDETGRVVFP
ncbi:exodeoxyribonuclease VII small subunit [Streptomyces sp. 7-21]|jgi:exodeoxyribonuclease VII small subunit|uniref:exodeoxyribonuclease VII small subunit n=1 Tax=Streptomyces sp. 7-21 TaxID=2802283 RepID=UPI00191ED520|nr:exodeoxyribonuclease VII small subunit [Streptomyces sp. 7-21]MBL1065834.1 exodeoxyribonuclease VII small subunit [Streptomyces sp. 7-21]